MKIVTALFISSVLLSGVSSSVASDEEPTLQELFARFHSLQAEQCSDDDRNDPLLFADISRKKLDDDERRGVRKIVLKTIADWEKMAKRSHPGLSKVQREGALRKLKRKGFVIDSRIKETDVTSIIKYFESHPSLDPRIIALRFTDRDTIRITTGVVRGPLDGGGSFYVARRENGRWIVRSDGGWVS